MSLQINPAIMNAACSVAKTLEDVTAMSQTNVGAVLVGSITVAARDGNAEPRWYPGDAYSLNSFGMPNEGYDYYDQHLDQMINVVHQSGKQFVLSVAGFTSDEYATLAKLSVDHDIDALELNLGCPNVAVDGQQKPIASFNPDYIREILEKVSATTKTPLLIKLSPYSNPAELKAVAELIAGYSSVAAVVTSNTFPNSYMLENDQPVLAMGYGGMSGRALQPIALGQVKQFRDHLPERISVIATGGIESADDVKLFQSAGADVVQAATLIVRDGHDAINRLTETK